MPITYGASGDVRSTMNAGQTPGRGSYLDEAQLPGVLITRHLIKATRIINAKLEKIYPDKIPFSASGDVPFIIYEIANDLATYYVKRDMHPGPTPMLKESKEDYYDEPMKLLDAIVNKEIEIPEFSGANSYPDTYDSNEGYTPVFDMDNIENQGVDPDRLDDIADARDD